VLAILAVIAGVVFARPITRPVVALTNAAKAMASGERGVSVADVEAPGELGDLSRTFNHMADTLELEDQLRRVLVADVAHELRTPLAILQATTEALADGITEPSAATLASLHDETLRLGRIVEDLEVLASAEAAGLALELKPLDLALVAEEAAEALKPQFEGSGLSLTCHLRPAVVGRQEPVAPGRDQPSHQRDQVHSGGVDRSAYPSLRTIGSQGSWSKIRGGAYPRMISDTSSIDSGGDPASGTPREAESASPSSKSWCTLTKVASPLRAK
jgi:signal transduction histidine kinase